MHKGFSHKKRRALKQSVCHKAKNMMVSTLIFIFAFFPYGLQGLDLVDWSRLDFSRVSLGENSARAALPAPGGVDTDLQLWLKADAGVQQGFPTTTLIDNTPAGTSSRTEPDVGQSFTISIPSGTITEMMFADFGAGTTATTVDFELYAGEAHPTTGYPATVVYSETAVPISVGENIITFSTPIPVLNGEKYTTRITNPNGSLVTLEKNAYFGGTRVYNSGNPSSIFDFAFSVTQVEAGVGTDVTAWTDQVDSNNIFADTATSTGEPNYLENGINFNPSLDFEGLDYLEIENDAFTGDFSTGGFDVFYVTQAPLVTTFDTALYFGEDLPQNGGRGLSFSQVASDRGSLVSLQGTGTHDQTEWDGTNTNASAHIWNVADADKNNVHTTASFYADGESITGNNISGDATWDGNTINAIVGNSKRNTGTDCTSCRFNGEIAEIIAYSNENGATERQQIQSYLALKYGITLDASAGEYKNSAGGSVYSLATHDNDVVGIGTDSDSTLDQQISRSVNSSAIITLSTDTDFTSPNGAHASLGDGQYLVIGNDGGTASWSATGAPANFELLDKTWKAEETGTVGAVNVQFDVANVPFDVPALIAGTNYYVVVDTNDDQDLSDETPAALANTSGDFWSTAVDFADGALFSIATELPEPNVISGTAYTSDGVTPFGAGKKVEVLLNGTSIASLTTDGSGEYTMTVPSLAEGDIVTAYLNDEAEQGVAIDKVRTNALTGDIINLENVSVYQDRVTVHGRPGVPGARDLSFVPEYEMLDPNYLYANAIGLQSDGKILVGGTLPTPYGANGSKHFFRLNADGTEDTTFPVLNFPIAQDSVLAVTVLADDSFYLSGTFVDFGGNTALDGLVRLSKDGVVDAGFTPPTGLGFGGGRVSNMVVESSGNIIVTGNFGDLGGNPNLDAIARLTDTGAIDTSWVPTSAFVGTPRDVQYQSDGKIIVVGGFTHEGDTNITRLMPNGAHDPTFSAVAPSSFINRVAIAPDDSMVIVGNFNDYDSVTGLSKMARLNADGSRDTGFVFDDPMTGNLSHAFIKPDGNIFFVGAFQDYGGIAGNNDIGMMDGTGKRDVEFVTPLSFSYVITAVVPQPDGNIILGGGFEDLDGQVNLDKVARIHGDNGISISNADLDTANNGDSDITDLYGVTAGAFAVNNSTELYVAGFYEPQGTVDAVDVTIKGQFDLDGNNATVEGDWDNVGRALASTPSEIVLDGADQILNGDSDIWDLTKTASGGETLTVNADTKISGDTLDISGTAVGNELTLRTDPDNGTNFGDLAFTNATGSFLDLKDVHNSARYGNDVNPTDSLDGGNSFGWYPAPGPGSIVGGISTWYKVTENGTTTTDGDPISTWEDSSPFTSNDGTAVGTPSYENDAASLMNFNPVAGFDGSSDGFTLPDNTLATGDSNYSTYSVFTSPMNAQGTLFSAGHTGSGGGFIQYLEGNKYNDFTAGGSSVNSAKGSLSPNVPAITASTYDTAVDTKKVYVNGKADGESTVVPDQNIWHALDSIGYQRSSNSNYFEGNLAETVTYEVAHGDTEREKITSYLALKFGITQHNSVGAYKSAAGLTTWDDTAYWNDIFGLAQEELADIDQRVSTSVSSGSVLTVATEADFISENTDARVAVGEGNYAVFGRNTGSLAWDAPVDGFSVLSRKWKSDFTGAPGALFYQFDVDNPQFNILPLTTGTDYYFVHDTNDDGDLTDETPVAMTEATGGLWETAAISIADGAIFSIAKEVDQTPPPTPAAPDLQAASDTGTSDTDNNTSDDTPTLDVDCTEIGATAKLYADNPAVDTLVTTHTCVAVAQEAVTVPSALTDGNYNFHTTMTDTSGNVSADSPVLGIVIVDTTDPSAPGAPDLQAASDTGASDTDDDTSDNTPTFDVDCTIVGGAMTLYSDLPAAGTSIGTHVCVAVATEGMTASTLPDGTHNVTVTETDLAGNEGAASSPTAVTIDATAPTDPAGAPDLQAASDTGASNTDDNTNDDTPTFDVACTEAGVTIMLFADNPAANTTIGTHTCAGVGTEGATTSVALADGNYNIDYDVMDTAGNASARSASLGIVVVDTAGPGAGGAPDLQAASDTGVSDTDDDTSDNTPTFDVDCSIVGSTITLYSDNPAAGTSVASHTCAAVATEEVTASTLPDGLHNVTATETDLAGNEGVPSTSIGVTIDANAPTAPSAPDLQAASDTGASDTDDDTSDDTPTFDVVCTIPGGTMTLYSDNPAVDTNVATHTCVAAATEAVTTSTLPIGVHAITAAETDLAGNEGAQSAPTVVTIDSVAPVDPSAAPDLIAASDTGASDTDNNTSDNTPTFDVDCTEVGVTAMVFADNPAVDTVLATHTCASVGTESVTTATTLSDGDYNINYDLMDTAGNVTARSSILGIVIVDTTDPSAPGAPDLQAASDTGASDADDDTGDNTPTFDVDCTIVGGTITLYSDNPAAGTSVSSHTCVAVATEETTTSTLPDGVHNITATETDLAGNEGVASTPIAVSIDSGAPATPVAPDLQAASDTGASDTDDNTSDDTPTLDVDCTEAGSVATLYTDNPAANTSVLTHTCVGVGAEAVTTPSALTDGNYNFHTTMTDPAGNVSADSPVLGIVIVDTTDPSAPAAPDLQDASDTGASNTDDDTSDDTPTFDVDCSIAGSTITLYSDNPAADTNVATHTCVAAATEAVTTSTLPIGAHNITAAETDLAGNEGAESTPIAVTIDTQDPTAPAEPDLQAASDTGASDTDDDTSDNTPTFDVDCSIAGATITLYSDNPAAGTSVASHTCVAVATEETTTSTLADSVHNITATETDLAGNEGAASTAIAVTIDSVAPVDPSAAPDLIAASDTGASDTDNNTNDDTPTFDVACTEAGATVRLFTDNPAANTEVTTHTCVAVGSEAVTVPAPLTDGNYNFHTTVIDTAGNESADSASLGIVILDTTDPTAPSAPDLQAASDTGASDTDDDTSDNTPTFDVDCSIAGSTITLYSDNPASGTSVASHTCVAVATEEATTSALPDGLHNITATETDLAGNEGVASTPTAVTIDSGTPATPAIPDLTDASDTGASNTDDNTSDDTPTIDVDCVEAGSTATLYTDNPAVNTEVLTHICVGVGAEAVTVPSALTDGNYNFHTTMTDPAGNVSADSPILGIVIVDTVAPATAPTITVPTNGNPVSGTGIADAAITVTTPSGATCSTTVLLDGSWSCALVPTPVDGEDVSASQADTAGNQSAVTAEITGIDIAPPSEPSVNTPTNGAPIAGTHDEPGVAIEVTTPSGAECSATVTAEGFWNCTLPSPVNGEDVTVVAIDGAENSTSITRNAGILLDTPTDTDGDGNPDAAEDALAPSGDGNGDGILDSQQFDVTTVANPESGVYTTLVAQSDDCGVVERFGVVSESSLSTQDAQRDYPVGLNDFVIDCSSAGKAVTLVFYYDQVYDTSDWDFSKFNSGLQTYTSIESAVTYSTANVNGVTVTTATYQVTDGGPRDADGSANGIIVDPAGPAAISAVPVYRFWSEAYSSHFYTRNESEKDAVIAQYDDATWRYEGVAFQAYESAGADRFPVYRFWSPEKKSHFYTSYDAEQQVVSADASWTYEGIDWYASSTGPTVYRFWSEGYQSHFYTTSEAEKNSIVANDANWVLEGQVRITAL